MKSSVLFALAGTVCCLSGLASAQVASTSAAAPAKQIGGGNEGVGFVDDCGSASTVGVGTYGFDTADATNDFAATCGASDTAGDKWIKYLAASTGLATVATCGSTADDTVLAVLAACGGPQIACVDDSCGGTLQSSISFSATAGTTYLIRIAGFFGDPVTGSVTISQSGGGGGGGNDNCADATLVTDGAYDFDTTNATPDAAPSCGASAGSNDVWFKYTAASAGVLTATTCDLAGHDTVLAAFGACGGAQLACNDDSCALQSRISVSVAAGSTTWVVVSGYNGASGSGQVAFSFAEPCSLVRPGTAVDENEPCQTDGGQDTNGGCNTDGSVTAVTNNSYVWGTASTFIDSATGGQFRDTDWYEINHAGGTLSVTGKADFDLLTFVLDTACPPALLGQGGPTAGNCAESNISIDLPAGTYRIFAGKGTFDGLPCAANNNYLLTIGEPGSCPSADFNGDGFTDFFDYDDFVACFEGEGAPGCNADFNGDAFIDFFDYDAYVFAFEGCQ
jgi:hypothetical protein